MFTIFLIIVLQLIGESIVQMSGLPVPGAIIGLVLLYVILVLRGEDANLLSVGAIDFGIIVDAAVIVV